MSEVVSTAVFTRAIIYCRVSSDKAGGRSVEEQERECRQECERQGWPVGEVLKDNDRSASRYATKDRPEYERLRCILRPGDVLVSWDASRLSRDMATMITLRDLCLERNVALSYGGQLVELDEPKFVIDAMMAEQEAKKTRERIMRAQRANLAAGRPHGRPVYGYRIVRDPDSGKSVGRRPHPFHAPLVAESVERLLKGETLGSVVRWLETQEPIGWDAAKVRRIVTNPAIAGYRTHNGQVHGTGTWEPIISSEQHADITALFAARKSGPRGIAVKHLLTGIACCAVCDAPLRRKLGGKDYKTGGRYEVLGCPNSCVARKLKTVEEAVTDAVEDILSTPELLASFAQQTENTPDVQAQNTLLELRERQARVVEQIAEGSMPETSGGLILTRIEEQIGEAIVAATTVYTSPVVGTVVNSTNPFQEWQALPVGDQREFIRSTMRVTVGKVGKGRWHDPRQAIDVKPIRR